MLDQSFSAENFRRIFDSENRRGIYLETHFFSDVAIITSELKRIKYEFRELKRARRSMQPIDYEARKGELNASKEQLSNSKEKLLSEHLERLSSVANRGALDFTLRETKTSSGKTAYYFEHEPISYFVSKQVQANIRKLYQVKQGNRNLIISQLEKTLGDSFPKIVIRTDIKGFYENISQSILMNKLNTDPLLTHSSKKFIFKTLNSYRKLSGEMKGIPRGLGVSAYLAEIYINSFDEAINNHPDVLFYARYVDDILVAFNPNPLMMAQDYFKFLQEQAINLEMELHAIGAGKTVVAELTTPKNVTINYLGYRLQFGNKETVVSLSSNKFDLYKLKIDKSFELYDKGKFSNEKMARKILIKRIRFLTGNTRLLNNKRNALVGIYFSNSKANDIAILNGLDQYLIRKVSVGYPPSVKSRITNMSFKEGFELKKYFKYSERDLKLIVAAWKNE
ncbi:MAG: hypothetical protein RL497_1088 [Pseudomonadota bacterium]